MRALLIAVIVAGALTVPADALAAPPTLTTVGQTQQHLTASWTLPPGVEARTLEVAVNPARGSDGSFFTENTAIFDVLETSQTSYLSSSARLRTGVTYYVHVSGIDWPCVFADACPIREWSNVMALFIPNAAPDLQSGTWNAYRFLRTGTATLNVCDDPGDFRVLFTQTRLHRGRVVARASGTLTGTLFTSPCGTLDVQWTIPQRLIRVGDLYRVTFTVADSGGASSRTLTAQSRWR